MDHHVARRPASVVVGGAVCAFVRGRSFSRGACRGRPGAARRGVSRRARCRNGKPPTQPRAHFPGVGPMKSVIALARLISPRMWLIAVGVLIFFGGGTDWWIGRLVGHTRLPSLGHDMLVVSFVLGGVAYFAALRLLSSDLARMLPLAYTLVLRGVMTIGVVVSFCFAAAYACVGGVVAAIIAFAVALSAFCLPIAGTWIVQLHPAVPRSVRF